MVRGPAAVLIGLGATLAYFVVAPALPEIRSHDGGIIVAGGLGLALVVQCAIWPLPAVSSRFVLATALAGGLLIVAGLAVANIGAAATPFEALFYGCVGIAFAGVLDAAPLAVALPVFVALVEIVSIAGGGASGLLVSQPVSRGDPLTLELPAWGGGLPAARISAVEVVFLAAFAAYAVRFHLREQATIAAMLAGLLLALVLTVALDTDIPVLALIAAGFVLPNIDRFPGLFRKAHEG